MSRLERDAKTLLKAVIEPAVTPSGDDWPCYRVTRSHAAAHRWLRGKGLTKEGFAYVEACFKILDGRGISAFESLDTPIAKQPHLLEEAILRVERWLDTKRRKWKWS